MGHTLKNGPDLEKNGSHLESVAHFKKWVTHEKIDNTWKSGSLLEKWVTSRKMGHT